MAISFGTRGDSSQYRQLEGLRSVPLVERTFIDRLVRQAGVSASAKKDERFVPTARWHWDLSSLDCISKKLPRPEC